MLDDFDFELPKNLIAQDPLSKGTEKLLHKSSNGKIIDTTFSNISNFLNSGDLLILNNTRVINAHLFGKIKTNDVSINLINKVIEFDGNKWEILGKPRNKILLNSKIIFDEDLYGVIINKGELDIIEFNLFGENFEKKLAEIGQVPLPPYIKRNREKNDNSDYQTIYGTIPGSVAAPTAGLHFSNEILNSLKNDGIEFAEITLHIGGGTFLPVRAENIREHKMHKEFYEINESACNQINNAIKQNRRIIAVGTTSLRTLESAMQFCDNKLYPHSKTTDIFITPGYKFKLINGLITNFHLPKSTLFMLICAFIDNINEAKEIYKHAIDNQYRFFSYGDVCFFVNN